MTPPSTSSSPLALRPEPARERATVGSEVLAHLRAEGVEIVFGIPGGPVTPLFDELKRQSAIRTISTRHESGAAFMAAGYARLRGGPGACLLTTGPGALNAVTAVAAAKSDSLPVVVLTAQAAAAAFGKGSLQDSSYDRCDVVEVFRPVTKLSAMIPHPAAAATMLRQALRTALAGRPGPVHLNIPSDLMRRELEPSFPLAARYRARALCVDRHAVREAAQRLLRARRPAVLAGHGVNLAGARAELRALAELLGIPVASTPKGKGAFPEDHPLALGVFGLASAPLAEAYLLSGDNDLLLVVGSTMHEISTQGWDPRLAPRSGVIQLDIDPTALGRTYPLELGLVGDARETLAELLCELRSLLDAGRRARGKGRAALRLLSGDQPLRPLPPSRPGLLRPDELVIELDEALPQDAAVFIDVGNHTLWSLRHLRAVGAREFVHNWGEFAAMGFGVAGAVGGKLAAPRRPVVAIVGDGGFGMSGMEVNTAVSCGAPVVWIVFNDGRYNAVHHGQTLQYAGRTIGTEFSQMDIAAAARALGAEAWTVNRPGQAAAALAEALACGAPAVIDARIDPDVAPPIGSRVAALEKLFEAGR